MSPEVAFSQHRQTYGERLPPPELIKNADQLKLLTPGQGRREFCEPPAEGVPTATFPTSMESSVNLHLWVVTSTHVPYTLEQSPFTAALESRVAKHTNLTGGGAAITGGEMWFLDEKTIIINGCSGRYGPRTHQELHDAAQGFKACGYRVGYVGYNEAVGEWGKVPEEEGDVLWL